MKIKDSEILLGILVQIQRVVRAHVALGRRSNGAQLLAELRGILETPPVLEILKDYRPGSGL